MSSEKPHFLARRFPDHQRSTTRPLLCPKCMDGGSIIGDAKFLDHCKSQHPDIATDAPDGPLWREILAEAINKAYVLLTAFRDSTFHNGRPQELMFKHRRCKVDLTDRT